MRKFFALLLTFTFMITMFPAQTYAYNTSDTVYLAAQGHQDTIWLWDEPDTVSQVITTFNNVFDCIAAQPGTVFTYPAAYNFDVLRRYRPDMFQRVLGYIQTGNIEAVGGQWVEPDQNIPGGENAVRQYLYGKQYMNDVLKAPESTIAYMPDTFGQLGTFPQIAKKVGLNMYYETKNDQIGGKTIKLPYFMNWLGQDGTMIHTINARSYGYTSNFTASSINSTMDFAILGQSDTLPSTLAGGRVIHDVARTYGSGDRGGGPTVSMVNAIAGLQAGNSTTAKAKFSSLEDYYKVAKVEIFPYVEFNWQDEMYMENSRNGTYSNDAAGKYLLRRSQDLAGEAEKFASAATWLGYSDYQYDKISEAYRMLELNVFHDNCYGRHMTVEPMRRHHSRFGYITNWLNDSLAYSYNSIASNINTTAASDGVPVVVYNALSYVRKDVAQVTVEFSKAPDYVKVFDTATNTEVLSQIIGKDGNSVTVIFEANDVPSVGYKLYKVVPSASASTLTSTLSASTSGTNQILANAALSATIANNGTISNLTLKDGNVNVVSAAANPMNELQFFTDTAAARDLNISQTKISTPLRLNSSSLAQTPLAPTIIEKGPVRTVVRVQKKIDTVTGTHAASGNSDFIMDYILYSNSNRVDILCRSNWDEAQRFLKTAFYTSFTSTGVTFDQPYGTLFRTSTQMIGTSAVKWEVCGQKWADMSGTISGGTYGVSILNNSKLGWDMFSTNCLRLSLLRSSTSNGSAAQTGSKRDEQRELGFYEDTYSIYPHRGTWDTANTVREAEYINVPLRTYVTGVHPGDLGNDFSFAKVSAQNVQLSVIKQAEGKEGSRSNSEGYNIIRLYETNGAASTPVTITFPGAVLDAFETDLIEIDRGDWRTGCTFSGNTITTTVKKYELKTIKFKLAPNTKKAALSKIVNLPFGEVGITTKANAAMGNIDNKGYTLPAMFAVTSFSNGGVPFVMGAADTNNLYRPRGETIAVGGSGYNSFNFIAAATQSENGSTRMDVTLKYGDGTTETSNVRVSDSATIGLIWNKTSVQDTIACYFPYAHKPDGTVAYSGYDRCKEHLLYEYSLPVNSGKVLESVTFFSADDSTFKKPHIGIFAATASGLPIYGKGDIGKTGNIQRPSSQEFFWNFSNLAPGATVGSNLEKLNIAGPLSPVFRNFDDVYSASQYTGVNGENANNILIDDLTTKYNQTPSSANLTFVMDAGSSIKVAGYGIRSANDDTSYTDRAPYSWTVSGSNSPTDGWVTLSTVTANTNDGNYNMRTFSFTQTESVYPSTGFRYYRLNITARGRGSSTFTGGRCQFSYFGLITHYAENGALTVKAAGGVTQSVGSVAINAVSGPTIVTVSGNVSSSATAPFTSSSYTSIQKMDIEVFENTKLSYLFKPENAVSANMALDLQLSDGSRLKDTNAVDQFGISVNPKAQGGTLTIGEWNYVEIDLGKIAKERTITDILLGFEVDNPTPGAQVLGSFDFINIYRGDSFGDSQVIAALYDNKNKLVAAENSMQPIVLDTSTAGDEFYVKVFLWSVAGFVPVLNATRYDYVKYYPNVALRKAADCSSANSATQTCSYLVDGVINQSNKWVSWQTIGGTTPPQQGHSNVWAVVDLGANYKIARWAVYHAMAGGEAANTNTSDFSVQVSADGVNFYTLKSVVNNADESTKGTCNLVFRYFKLDITKGVPDGSGQRNCSRIPEIELYGELAAPGMQPDFTGLSKAAAHTPRHLGAACRIGTID